MELQSVPVDLEALLRDLDDLPVGPWNVDDIPRDGPLVRDRYGEVIFTVGVGHVGGGRPIGARLERYLRMAALLVRWKKEIPRVLAELRDAREELARLRRAEVPGWVHGP
jgi:hypothetical protein